MPSLSQRIHEEMQIGIARHKAGLPPLYIPKTKYPKKKVILHMLENGKPVTYKDKP